MQCEPNSGKLNTSFLVKWYLDWQCKKRFVTTPIMCTNEKAGEKKNLGFIHSYKKRSRVIDLLVSLSGATRAEP
jgi:hypothetical protein